MKNNFNIDGVSFPLDRAVRLFKKCEKFSKDYLLKYIYDKNTFNTLWEKEKPMEAAEVFALDNAEQRMIAIKYIGMAELLSHYEHKVLDKQTVKKQNKRWSINQNGEIEQRVDLIDDTYELLKVKYKEGRETFDIVGIRCKCTTTEREYFIYVPPINDNWDKPKYPTDAITAIASTFRINVKPEAVKAIRRQGDVINVVIKKDWEGKDWKCNWRPVTKDEYLTKLESET